MKKIIPALLIATPLLLAGCGQNNEDKNETKHTDNTESTTKSKETTSEQNYKDITLSDIFADGKPHILYRISPMVENGGEDNKHQPVKVVDNSIDDASVSQVIYVKNNQARQFFIYSNDDLRLGKLTERGARNNGPPPVAPSRPPPPLRAANRHQKSALPARHRSACSQP